jgi:endonuclease/exonuclease/phosphatase family metal-dependent hydrolase
MKKIGPVRLFFFFLLSAFSFAQADKGINAMSFNIRYDNPEDGKQNWHNRKDNMVRMVHFYDVDIMGLQEVLLNQLLFLKESLPDYDHVGVGREDGATQGEFAPIFYRKSRFELLDNGTFWLSPTPGKVGKGWDAALERIATWAVFKDRDTGRECFFMNTHFDHRGDMARVKSAELLKQKAMDLAGNRPVILTGDFNLTPDSEGIKSLTDENGENTLKNTRNLALHTYGPEWTSCGFDYRPYDERKTIDYIFVNKVAKVQRHAVFAETLNDLFLSDHCPVFAQIVL